MLNQAADFTKFKTFTIRDGQLNAKKPALDSELTKKNLQTEIEKALTAKGAPQRRVVTQFSSHAKSKLCHPERSEGSAVGLARRQAKLSYHVQPG